MKSANFLLKISRFFLFFFGVVITAICLGLGIVGKVYANQEKDFLNQNIASASSTINDISEKATILQDEINGDDSDLAIIYDKLNEFVDNAISTLTNQKTEITTLMDDVLERINQTSNQEQKEVLQAIYYALEEVNDNMIGSKDDSGYTILSILYQINGVINSDDGTFNLDDAKSLLNNLIDSANQYLNPINSFLSSWNNEQKVNSTYDTTTTVLLSVGSVLLGLVIIGSVFSLICYKRVDGKLVSRFNSQKDVKKHIDKILKKYPEVKKMLETTKNKKDVW